MKKQYQFGDKLRKLFTDEFDFLGHTEFLEKLGVAETLYVDHDYISGLGNSTGDEGGNVSN